MHTYSEEFRVTIRILNIQQLNSKTNEQKSNKYSLQIRLAEELLIFSKEDLDVDFSQSYVQKTGKFTATYNQKTGKYELKGTLKVYEQSKHTKFDTILGITSLSGDMLLNQLYTNKTANKCSYQLQKIIQKVKISIIFIIQKINDKNEKQQPEFGAYQKMQIKETCSIKSQQSSVNRSSPMKNLVRNENGSQAQSEEFQYTNSAAKVVQSMNLQNDKKFLKNRKQRTKNNVQQEEIVDNTKYYEDQIKILGQQLIVERRKIVESEKKYINMKEKYDKLKKKCIQDKKIDTHSELRELSDLIQQCKVIIDNQKKIIIIQYTEENFVDVLQNKISILTNSQNVQSDNQKSKIEIEIINEQLIEQKNLLAQENQSLKQINLSLNQKFHDQKQKLLTFETRITQLTEEIYFIEAKNRSMVGQIEQLQQMLAANRQKIVNYQQLLAQKQLNIQNLTRRNWKQKEEIGNIQKLNEDLKNKNKNYKLQIDQNIEQIENLNELIDKYKKKYGQMKHQKNKDLEFQIKDCLRWIEKQTLDCEIQPIQHPSLYEDQISIESGLNSVFNSLEISEIPASKLVNVRNQLVKVLEKLDNLMQDAAQQNNL